MAVSFGTSYEDSCRQTIGALEEDFAENFSRNAGEKGLYQFRYHADLGRAGSTYPGCAGRAAGTGGGWD